MIAETRRRPMNLNVLPRLWPADQTSAKQRRSAGENGLRLMASTRHAHGCTLSPWEGSRGRNIPKLLRTLLWRQAVPRLLPTTVGPFTQPSPKGRGSVVKTGLQDRRPRSTRSHPRSSPLPGGEGQDEGEPRQECTHPFAPSIQWLAFIRRLALKVECSMFQ